MLPIDFNLSLKQESLQELASSIFHFALTIPMLLYQLLDITAALAEITRHHSNATVNAFLQFYPEAAAKHRLNGDVLWHHLHKWASENLVSSLITYAENLTQSHGSFAIDPSMHSYPRSYAMR